MTAPHSYEEFVDFFIEKIAVTPAFQSIVTIPGSMDDLKQALLRSEGLRGAILFKMGDRSLRTWAAVLPLLPRGLYRAGKSAIADHWSRSSSPAGPPLQAERLVLLFTPPERADERAGDFEESFRRVAAERGQGLARAWYWWQALSCVFGPVLQLLWRVMRLLEMVHDLFE